MTPERGVSPVRSFIRREGRLTPGQKQAFTRYWSQFGVGAESAADVGDANPRLDLDRLFGRRAPRTLEIGFGNGESLLTQAETFPDRDFLGIEVYRPGIGHFLLRLAERKLSNVRVICDDAVSVLGDRLADACLDQAQIFFPDPWPKKRHHKRRLIQPPFVELLARKLKAGGLLHLATDWENYAEQMRSVLDDSANFQRTDAENALLLSRPPTKYERRGLRQGHVVRDFFYQRR